MNEGLEEAESFKNNQRWLAVAIILTCGFWIEAWADFAFGYVSWKGYYFTIVEIVMPVFAWLMMARRYNRIDKRLTNLIAVVLFVACCILMAAQYL